MLILIFDSIVQFLYFDLRGRITPPPLKFDIKKKFATNCQFEGGD